MNVIERMYDKAKRETIPLGVQIDLTYRCHQRCIHCYIPDSWRRGEGPHPELTTGQLKKILDQLAEAGTFFLIFSGGEIFLRPDLMELVAYARSLNFSLSLYTSGTLGLDKEKVRALAAIGIEGLFVSVYHLDHSVHDRVTGISGSGKHLWQTLENCWTCGVRTTFNSPALSLNYQGIREIQKFTEPRHIALRVDRHLSPRWDGTPHPAGLAISDEEKKGLWAELGLSDCSAARCEPLTVPEMPEEDLGCDVGFTGCYIRPDGEVWPCMEINWTCGVLGNGMDFKQLWQHSETLRRIRAMHTKELLETTLCVYARESWQHLL
jgi:AdoMet-dependent heme synthase